MARRNAAVRPESEFALPAPASAPREARADDGAPAALDGARLAQAVLAARLADESLATDAAPRWSRRRGLALAIGASATLWMAAAVAVRLVLVR